MPRKTTTSTDSPTVYRKRSGRRKKQEQPENGHAQLLKELWQAAVNLRGSS